MEYMQNTLRHKKNIFNVAVKKINCNFETTLLKAKKNNYILKLQQLSMGYKHIYSHKPVTLTAIDTKTYTTSTS